MEFENVVPADTSAMDGRDSIRMVLIATLATVLFWFLPFVGILLFPIRIFVTYVHEFCHAMAALLTLGWPHQIEIFLDASGVTYTTGGVRLLVSSAGYVGTPLIGAAMLLLSTRRRYTRPTLATAGLVLILTSVLLGGNLLAWIAGLSIGALLMGIGARAPIGWARFALSFLSIQLILNALLDLKSLLYLSIASTCQTDAQNMADATYGLMPALLWTLLWALLSVGILVAAVRMYMKLTVSR